jgi:hypothetical protein
MEPVVKVPNNSVPKLETELLEDRVKPDVQGKDFALLDVISDLPRDVALGVEYPVEFSDNGPEPLKVMFKSHHGLILLADVVRGAGDDEFNAVRGKGLEPFKRVPFEQGCLCTSGQVVRDRDRKKGERRTDHQERVGRCPATLSTVLPE